MKKIVLVLMLVALVAASAAPAALAQVYTSSSAEREASAKRLEDAGKRVEEKVKSGASPAEIAAAVAEAQRIYDEIRAQQEAEAARLFSAAESVPSKPAAGTMRTSTELRLGGAPVSGVLSHGEEIWYSARAAENGILIVETFSGIDTYLEAYDDRQDLIKEDDDGGDGFNARIEIPVTAGRTYLFKLRGYSSDVAGPFRIFAASEPAPSAPAAVSQNEGGQLRVTITGIPPAHNGRLGWIQMDTGPSRDDPTVAWAMGNISNGSITLNILDWVTDRPYNKTGNYFVMFLVWENLDAATAKGVQPLWQGMIMSRDIGETAVIEFSELTGI